MTTWKDNKPTDKSVKEDWENWEEDRAEEHSRISYALSQDDVMDALAEGTLDLDDLDEFSSLDW